MLPAWWYKVWKTLTTVALDKGNGAVRPVGIEPCLARSLHKVVNRKNKNVLTSFFEPQQLALSVAGGAKLVHSVRMLAEENPGFVVVKCDIRNAFNSVSRGRILEVLESEDSLRHLTGMLLCHWHHLMHWKVGVRCGGKQRKGQHKEILRLAHISVLPGIHK